MRPTQPMRAVSSFSAASAALFAANLFAACLAVNAALRLADAARRLNVAFRLAERALAVLAVRAWRALYASRMRL